MRSPKAKRNPQLSPEEWVAWGKKVYSGDQAAYDKLVFDYEPLMKSIAWDIARKFDPDHDGHLLIKELLAEGQVALCEVARNWNYKVGWFFPKYARKWIWGRLMDQVGACEIIARTTKDTRDAETIAVISTETIIGTGQKRDHDLTLGATLEDVTSIPLHDYIVAKEELRDARDQISAILTTVTQECRTVTCGGGAHKKVVPDKVFMSLYGLDTSDHSPQWGAEKTQREVGDQFGVSDESVRQAVARIWRRISTAYCREDLKRYVAIVLACREVELA